MNKQDWIELGQELSFYAAAAFVVGFFGLIGVWAALLLVF
jgi:hypothetical protein